MSVCRNILFTLFIVEPVYAVGIWNDMPGVSDNTNVNKSATSLPVTKPIQDMPGVSDNTNVNNNALNIPVTNAFPDMPGVSDNTNVNNSATSKPVSSYVQDMPGVSDNTNVNNGAGEPGPPIPSNSIPDDYESPSTNNKTAVTH